MTYFAENRSDGITVIDGEDGTLIDVDVTDETNVFRITDDEGTTAMAAWSFPDGSVLTVTALLFDDHWSVVWAISGPDSFASLHITSSGPCVVECRPYGAGLTDVERLRRWGESRADYLARVLAGDQG